MAIQEQFTCQMGGGVDQQRGQRQGCRVPVRGRVWVLTRSFAVVEATSPGMVAGATAKISDGWCVVGGRAISGKKGSRMGGSNEKRVQGPSAGFGTDAYVTRKPPTHLSLTASPPAPFLSPVRLLTPPPAAPTASVRGLAVVLSPPYSRFSSNRLRCSPPRVIRGGSGEHYNKTGIAIILQCLCHPSYCFMSSKTLATPPLFVLPA